RLLLAVPTMLMVLVLVFSILHLTASDPARLVAGGDADVQTVELVRQQLGLDQPLPVQFAVYVGNILHLDLGRSLHSKAPVASELAARLPATLLLACTALLIAIIAGTVIGVLTALTYSSAWD